MANEKSELRLIEKVLEESKEALSLSEIKSKTGLKIGERTVLRRLEKLINDKIIERIGKKKGTAYIIVSKAKDNYKNFETDVIPLREESKEILSLVSRSIENRKPVGYNKEFLENYKANTSYYLTDKEKMKLHELGRTARHDEPAGTYAKDILQRLLIDLSWNSSRLEGNTYSLLDTERLISIGEEADNKPAKDTQMILNHKDAIEFIVENSEDIGFNRYTIQNIHALLSNNLLPDPSASGRLRTFGVGIQQSVYTPLGIPQVIEEMFDRMLEKVKLIEDPFEQAFFIMVQLPYLQPFDDVNKRVSRIAANIPLNKRNFVPISFIDVPDSIYIQGLLAVYELNRIELLKDVFLWAYERSSIKYSALKQSLGEPDMFRLKYRDQIRSLLSEIVNNGLPYDQAIKIINERAELIPGDDRNRFIETIENELINLHEGNIARYMIRPKYFYQWKTEWRK